MSALACYQQLDQDGQLAKMQTPRKLSSPSRGNFQLPRIRRVARRPRILLASAEMAIESALTPQLHSESLEGPSPIAFAVVDVTHLVAASCVPLLISQGHNGVRLRRAECRDVAGEQRDSGQDQRDDDERQWVGGLDAIEQAGQEAGQS